MKGEHWFIAIVILVEILLVVFVPSTSWRVQSLLLGRSGAITSLEEALRENTALRAELVAGAETKKNAQSGGLSAPLVATVYSHYPFNLKNELLINLGSESGVVKGDPVLVPLEGDVQRRGLLLGKVETVFKNQAVVQTIFDSQFQTAVRLGNKNIDALLVGGAEPKLTLIAKGDLVAAGDAVITAGRDMPYGTPVGVVTTVTVSADQLFKEAALMIPYDVNGLRAVLVDTLHVAS